MPEVPLLVGSFSDLKIRHLKQGKTSVIEMEQDAWKESIFKEKQCVEIS